MMTTAAEGEGLHATIATVLQAALEHGQAMAVVARGGEVQGVTLHRLADAAHAYAKAHEQLEQRIEARAYRRGRREAEAEQEREAEPPAWTDLD